MRFLIIPQPDPDAAPPSAPPSEEILRAYMKFNEDLHTAGVLLASEGVNPDGGRARIGIKNGRRALIDGPYAESKELIGGFWMIEAASRDEAVAWALKAPTGAGFDAYLEVVQMTDLADLPPEMKKIIAEEAPTWAAAARAEQGR